MNFWYVESQRPTRDERSWVICMAEAGIHINDVALYFNTLYIVIKKKQLFTEHSIVFCKPVWLETVQDRIYRQNQLHSRNVSFISHQGGRDFFFLTNFLCWTSRTCLWYTMIRRNHPERSPMHMERWSKYWHFVDSIHFWQALRSIQIKYCNDACKILYWSRL